MFEILVPLLLGFATVLFAYSPRIARGCARARQSMRNGNCIVISVAALLPVSIYGGYFGAGVGVLVLGVLSVGTGGDYRSRQRRQESGGRASTV